MMFYVPYRTCWLQVEFRPYISFLKKHEANQQSLIQTKGMNNIFRVIAKGFSRLYSQTQTDITDWTDNDHFGGCKGLFH